MAHTSRSDYKNRIGEHTDASSKSSTEIHWPEVPSKIFRVAKNIIDGCINRVYLSGNRKDAITRLILWPILTSPELEGSEVEEAEKVEGIHGLSLNHQQKSQRVNSGQGRFTTLEK